MPTILSRFDTIFIVKDEHDQQKDIVSFSFFKAFPFGFRVFTHRGHQGNWKLYITLCIYLSLFSVLGIFYLENPSEET